ncbi:MAG: DUF2953 domain-containing protein [Gammaproteobacteria bacterium]|nr:DUF2953 domain-containing protein [Gammaproteobacteria bacterium]MCF6260508.1 DUF2953 domain-containing protein [Gammaproteobacteria bacterium]
MLTGMAVFLLLITLLVIPVTLTFKISWQQIFQSDVKLLWLFGLVCVRLFPSQPEIPAQENDELIKKVSYFWRSSREKTIPFAVIRQKAFRQRITRFIRDLWHAVQKRNLGLHIHIGLGDPADTGQLWAVVGPIAGMLSNVQGATIEIKPEFIDPTFKLDSSGTIRLIPLQLIYLIIALLLSPSIWRGVKKMRTAAS